MFKNAMKKAMTKKAKGYVVTLEMLSALLIWTALMSATVYVINNQRWQKLMYTSFCSAAMQTAKWGGTDTNIMHVNGKDEDIAASMEARINSFYPGAHVSLSITPTKVTPDNPIITVTLRYIPPYDHFGLFSFGVGTRTNVITGSFNSIAKGGKLL